MDCRILGKETALPVTDAPKRSGQIRSPMLGGAPPPASAAPRRAAPPQDFGGMGFGQEQNDATRLGTVMFDGRAQTTRSLARYFVIFILVLAIGGVAAVPGLRNGAVKAFTTAKDAVTGIRYQSKKKKKVEGSETEVAGEDEIADEARPVAGKKLAATTRKASAKAVALSADCKTLRGAANAGEKLVVSQRVKLADCFLLIDDPAGASQAMEPLRAEVDKATEAELNAKKPASALADAQQTMIVAALRQGKTKEAARLVKNRCQRWSQNNACVARALLAVDQGDLPANAARTLFGGRGKLEPKAQARLWLAGAKHALLDGKPQTADQRYTLALEAAPRDAVALRKHIYETQAVDLYARGEMLKLKNLVVEAVADLAAVEEGPKLKLKLLVELSTASDRPKIVRSLLAREDVVIRARSDFELIEILGPEALKVHQEEPFLGLLRKTADRAGGTQSFSRWETRALISGERFEKAHEALQVYDKAYGEDVFSRHMRGINYMLQDGSPRMQVLAAAEFKEAYRLQKSWESLAALGMALARGNKMQQVPQILRDLEKHVQTKGQRYWADMLKAEYYVAKEMYVAAVVILNRWIKAEPGYVTPRRLRLQSFQRMGKKEDADQEQLELDELARATRYAASREGFSSPIGIMALATRPLD